MNRTKSVLLSGLMALAAVAKAEVPTEHLVFHVDASEGSTLSCTGNEVTEWRSTVGSGHLLSATTVYPGDVHVKGAPILVTENEKPGVMLSRYEAGTPVYAALTMGSGVTVGAKTIIVVNRQIDVTGNLVGGSLFGTYSGYDSRLQRVNGSSATAIEAESYRWKTDIFTDHWDAIWLDGEKGRLYFGDLCGVTAPQVTVAVSSTTRAIETIGGSYFKSSSYPQLVLNKCVVHEVLMYDEVLTDEQIKGISDELFEKWGYRKTLYGDWNANPIAWTDADGAAANWEDGSWAVVTNLPAGNRGLSGPVNCYGLVVDAPRSVNYWNDGHVVSIGAGGMEFKQVGVMGCGSSGDSQGNARFRLMADQTWKGLAEGDYSDVSIGWEYAWLYWKLPLYVDQSVHDFTLEGKLRLWLWSYANDFSGVDVTVKAPAQLLVVKSAGTAGAAPSVETNGKIRARKLKLVGDGSMMLPLGGRSQWFITSYDMTFHDTLDPEHFTETLELCDGADIAPGAPITMSIPNLLVSGSGESVLSGAWTMACPRTKVTFSDGGTLNLAGTFVESAPGASIDATGDGTLKVNLAGHGLTGPIALGAETTLVLTGVGSVPSFTGGKALRIAADEGGCIYLNEDALADFSGDSIVVSSGTLILDDKLEGVKVTTEGTGAVLYAKDDPTIVTDAVRAEESLTLTAGQTLKVFGSGLTAATALTLAEGNDVVFYATATIGSPVTVSASATPCRLVPGCAGVTGTLAGLVTVVDGARLTVDGDVNVVFAGGAGFSESGHLAIRNNAAVTMTNGDYDFGGSASISMGDVSDGTYVHCARYLGVKDGANLVFAQIPMSLSATTALDVVAPVNYSSGANPTVFEIGEGGYVVLPGNRVIRVGSYGGASVLKLSGGTLYLGDWSYFYLGFGAFSTGTIEFSAGCLEQHFPMRLNGELNNSFVRWTGGTWKLATPGTFPDKSLWTEGLSPDGTRRVAVSVEGDCTMDLSDCPMSEAVNIVDTTNRGEWYGNGKLTVKGGKTFVMKSFPNGIDLVLEGAGTKVLLDADTRVFDYETCVANCIWRAPANINYSSSSAELANLSLRSLTVADGAAMLVNDKADRTVNVATASVAAGGVWDNASTFVSALRSIGSLVFAENGIWQTTFVDGTAPALTLTDALTLPSALGYSVSGHGTLPPRLISAPSVTGTPVWSRVSGRRGCTPVLFDDGLGFELSGTAIIIR